MKRIGFIVNPIAGMGGRVGLKGTDGVVKEAIERGAKPVAAERAKEFLCNIKKKFEIWTCSPPMGADVAKKYFHDLRIVYEPSSPTTAQDTMNAARNMEECDILVFVGGDGTAADVLNAVGKKMPVLGVPAGVKMYSAVFAYTPRHAAEIVDEFADELPLEEREVVDVDEEAFRKGNLVLSIKGYMIVPVHKSVQASKMYSEESESKRIIAEYVVESMDDDTVYIIGSGSTTYEVKKLLNIEGTFLGIDVVKGKKLICKDASEEEIKKALGVKNKILISPLGGHGFIFGRGNEQISAEIIKKVGKENIMVISSPEKLASLPSLKVDTGDAELDESLHGYIEVITGYKEKKIMRVE